MAGFTATIKNISVTDNEKIVKLEAETEARDKIFTCELPKRLNTFNKDDHIEIELDYSKPAEERNTDIEMVGRIYAAETSDNSTTIYISFSGLLSKFTFPENYFQPRLKKTVYLSIKKI